MTKVGALPFDMIHQLLDGGFVTGVRENVRPGSMDLSLSDDVYRVRGTFLPGPDESVLQAIRRVGGVRLRGKKPLLEKGCCYCIALSERVVKHLPSALYAFCNPKSSSGRVDVHVRLIVDRSSRYDAVDKNYRGPLWLLLVPKTFPVLVSGGLTLNQMRFFNQDTRFGETELSTNFELSGGLLFDSRGRRFRHHDLLHTDSDGSVLLSLGLRFNTPGFEAIETGEPIDLSQKGHYDPRKFFREVTVRNNSIMLRRNVFYILSSLEHVRVPAHLACEMRPMDDRSGEHRSHYAGFIDPGWGLGPKGNGVGRPLTLEVRSFENGMIVQHGQPIAKIRFERMITPPPEHYDQMSPTYGVQSGPKLGKYFSEWK